MQLYDKLNSVVTMLSTVVLDKEPEIKLALTCLLAKGHLLIEDLPGMGKTTLSHALAITLGLSYQRVQFTSDLLPSDIIGTTVFNQDEHNFEFHPGPVFNQVVLADEINRAGPKTQSALLEAMEEQQVSVDGTSHPLPHPFFVIATQNPLHQAGTYVLPESQLDRFLMRITLGYPSKQAERDLLLGKKQSIASLPAVLTADELMQAQESVTRVHASEEVADYVLELVTYTRQSQGDALALSPRASLALLQAAKAFAFLDKRDFVTHDDVQAVFPAVAEHRLTGSISEHLSPQSERILENVNL